MPKSVSHFFKLGAKNVMFISGSTTWYLHIYDEDFPFPQIFIFTTFHFQPSPFLQAIHHHHSWNTFSSKNSKPTNLCLFPQRSNPWSSRIARLETTTKKPAILCVDNGHIKGNKAHYYYYYFSVYILKTINISALIMQKVKKKNAETLPRFYFITVFLRAWKWNCKSLHPQEIFLLFSSCEYSTISSTFLFCSSYHNLGKLYETTSCFA